MKGVEPNRALATLSPTTTKANPPTNYTKARYLPTST